LNGAGGRVFCVFVGPPPGTSPRGGVLFVPPFAEEMNKARRQVMLQARSLAAAGYGVLLLDLHGTGDSEGNFAEARWDTWRGDLLAGARWLEGRGYARVGVWSLRFGSLLAAEVFRELGARAQRLTLWQPVLDGRQFMDQFIRMRVASSMMAGGARVTVQDLRRSLDGGENVEVAGYDLDPELVRSVDAHNLNTTPPAAGAVVDWIEVVGDQDAGVSVGSQRVIANWRQAGVEVGTATVVGQQFWATVEITVVPALIEHTTRCFASRA
jgi:exosortase A-associated hydrolase 2